MPGYRNRRFTIYDAMEAAGVFEANPANTLSRDAVSGESLYRGPVEYPRMFYHPSGETKITVPGELVETKLGVKLLGQQRELISAVANNAEEEARLLAEGWHDHPAKAIHAGGGVAPPMTSNDRISQLESELARLRATPLSVAPLSKTPQPSRQTVEAE